MQTLKGFKNFMSVNGANWVLINQSDSMLSYQRNNPGQKGSCLIALILLILGIVPGLLYLYFSHRSPSTNQLTITEDDDGNLSASGDAAGLKLYNYFLAGKYDAGEKIKDAAEKNSVIIICVVIAVLALFFFMMTR
ncbi:MAG: hypothetical protein PHO56_02275 [Patescibacteria group bacterium]|nr:hypothetical protein [Patescibacteria group bacterium]